MQQAILVFVPLVLAITFLIFWQGTRDSLKKRSRVPYLQDIVVTNTVPSGWNYGGHVEWTSNAESAPKIDCYTATVGDLTCSVMNIANDGENWTADVATTTNATFTFDIYTTLDSNTVSSSVDFAITCMLGHVPILTSNGVKLARDVVCGDKFVQPNGDLSEVKRVMSDVITENTKIPDARLFVNDEAVITYWHKVLVNGEWMLPEAAGWLEVTGQMALPLDIFHFALEKPSDVIMSKGLILESLY
jgi:hypothetical protein